MKRRIIQIVGLMAAVGCIVAGIMTGEVKTVFAKAVRICLECIGLGMVALVVCAGVGLSNPVVTKADTKKVVVCDDVSCTKVDVTVPDDLKIETGKKLTIAVTISKAVGKKISYKSSNRSRATVSKAGVVKGKKRGNLTVKTTVKLDGAKEKLVFKTKVVVI